MDEWTVFFRSFAKTVRTHRLRQGLTQGELAQRLGFQRTYIADIERGARAITLKSAWKIAFCLQIELSQLISEVEICKTDADVAKLG